MLLPLVGYRGAFSCEGITALHALISGSQLCGHGLLRVQPKSLSLSLKIHSPFMGFPNVRKLFGMKAIPAT